MRQKKSFKMLSLKLYYWFQTSEEYITDGRRKKARAVLLNQVLA
jgi:hypothetical protein